MAGLPQPGSAPAGQPTPAGADPLPSAVVFDLDGVLADVRHRLHFVTQRPKDWDAFFASAPLDPPLTEGLTAVQQAQAAGHAVVYLTGRPERCRADTVAWLTGHGLPTGPLIMRPDTDRRPARQTKVAALRRLAGQWSIHSLVDDDAAVAAAARAAGFSVRHVSWMTPSSSTDGAQPSVDPQAVLFEIQEDQGRT